MSISQNTAHKLVQLPFLLQSFAKRRGSKWMPSPVIFEMPAATCFDFPQLKDEVTAILQDAVLSSLEGNAYNHSKVRRLTLAGTASLEWWS